MIKIGRPNIEDAPAWYPYFFNLATDNDLITALQNNRQQMFDLIQAIPAGKQNYKYADDKWTVKQVFIHLADEERYYAYKAYCYSREVNVYLEVPQGDAYNTDFNAENRTLADVCEELMTVRDATISLFKPMSEEMLDCRGPVDISPVYTARSLGWMTVGHNIHHCNLLKERYLL